MEKKFRGISKETNNFVYGGITSMSHTIDSKTFIVSVGFPEGFEEDEDFIFLEVKPETVGQFTGLKDKGGVEIYEGDIYINPDGNTNHFYKVYFKNGAFCGGLSIDYCIPLGFSEDDHDIDPSDTDWVKVIGNIHQNHELL